MRRQVAVSPGEQAWRSGHPPIHVNPAVNGRLKRGPTSLQPGNQGGKPAMAKFAERSAASNLFFSIRPFVPNGMVQGDSYIISNSSAKVVPFCQINSASIIIY